MQAGHPPHRQDPRWCDPRGSGARCTHPAREKRPLRVPLDPHEQARSSHHLAAGRPQRQQDHQPAGGAEEPQTGDERGAGHQGHQHAPEGACLRDRLGGLPHRPVGRRRVPAVPRLPRYAGLLLGPGEQGGDPPGSRTYLAPRAAHRQPAGGARQRVHRRRAGLRRLDQGHQGR
ncbi:hypothetical protein D3C72_1640900 [compost metagenome]